MLNVQTYIYDRNAQETAPSFLLLKDYQFLYYDDNFYIYFTVEQDGKVLFETSSELAGMLWFIVLQIMDEAIRTGAGEWEFPSLLRMEKLMDGQFKLMNHQAAITFPVNVLFPALLDGFEEFMQWVDRYFYNQEPTIYEQRITGYREQVAQLRAYVSSI